MSQFDRFRVLRWYVQKNPQASLPGDFYAFDIGDAGYSLVAVVAAAAAVTAAVAAAASAAAASTATAAAARLTRLGGIDCQRPSVEGLAVGAADGLLRFVFVRHFDKAKATGLAGFAVSDYLAAGDCAVGNEKVGKCLVGGVIAEVADI